MTQKESCLICQILQGKIPSKVIYEDELCMALLDINGASLGHTFVIPKNHYPIVEQIPDQEFAHLFDIANKVSVALFEQLGAQGTNIFITNGIPAGQTIAHTMVHVIPRKENDGINLQWEPRQLDEEEMSIVEIELKKMLGTENIATAPTTSPSPAPAAPVAAAAKPAPQATQPKKVQPPAYQPLDDDAEAVFRRLP